jgi:hypothetical protein
MKAIKVAIRDVRTDLSNALALLIHEAQAMDVAIGLTGHTTDDGFGLAWFIVTPAAFQARFNQAPAPIAEPQPFQGNAVDLRNQQREWDTFELQEHTAAWLRMALINSWPQHWRQAVEVNHSLNHAHIRDLYVQLRAAFPLTEADITMLKTSLSTPLKDTDNIRAFVNNQRNTLASLVTAGYPLPALLAIEEMSKAFKSNARDAEDFAPMFAEFRLAHGALAAQTVAHFTAFVITFVEQRLPHHRQANAARRQAHVALVVPAAPVAVAVAEAAVAQPVQQQAGRGAQHGRGGHGGRGGRGGRGGGGRGPAAPHPGQPRPYCHTHGGAAPGQRGHYSVSCNNPGPNHNWDATFLNQMGGLAAV